VAHSPDNCPCPTIAPTVLSNSNPSVTVTDQNDEMVSGTTINKECMICMEELIPSSLVSWSSRRNGCGHAYHKDCIREWLLRHSECPYCRQVMLPIDGHHGVSHQNRNSSAVLQMWTTERIRRHDTTQYCQIHGVVDIVLRDCCPEDAKDKLEVATMTMATTATTTITPSLQNPVTEVLGQDENHSEVPTEPPLPCVDDKSGRMPMLIRPSNVDNEATNTSSPIDVEAQEGSGVVGVTNQVQAAPEPCHTEFGSGDLHEAAE
jgi:Ring finger domain